MAEDMENENDQPEITEQPGTGENNRSEQRFKDLSDKYAKADQAREQAEKDKANAQKEVEFYKNFTPLTSKYQAAGELQDKIKEKVMAGYDVEDATVSVLMKEGKFPQAQEPRRDSPIGGSATTALKSEAKDFGEMNRTEKREALGRLEQESGGISNLFNRTLM